MSLKLSIEPFLDGIIQKGEAEASMIVTAPTGSGKSTGIPVGLAKKGYRVFISEPTGEAVRNAIQRVNTFYPEMSVGYAIGTDIQYTDDTKIVYTTSGYLRKKILEYFNKGMSNVWNFTSFLIIDEYHVGSSDNFIIYNLWKYAKYLSVKTKKDLKLPHVILASATTNIALDPEISEYKIASNTYNVTVEYQNQSYSFYNNKLYIQTANVVSKKHNSGTLIGHILVFAPGKFEIDMIINNLTDVDDAEILPAYGRLPRDLLSKIYQESGRRKIIVATNVIESSVTINNIGLVVDTMCEKILLSSDSGGSRLVKTNISKASADQRKGRTGRTGPGTCVRMITMDDYYKLQDFRANEINRISIDNIVMELINVGVPPQYILNKISSTTKVPIEQIADSVRRLKKYGSIDSSNKITEVGVFVTHFPLSIQNATSLWYWINSGSYLDNYAGIVLLSIIDSYGPDYTLLKRIEESMSFAEYIKTITPHSLDIYDDYISDSDIEVYLKIWNDLMKNTELESPYMASHIYRFTSAHELNRTKIRELISIVKQIKNTLLYLEYNVIENNEIDYSSIVGKLRQVLNITYSDSIFTLKQNVSQAVYREPKTGNIYTLDSRKLLNRLRKNRPDRIFVLNRQTRTDRQSRVFYNISLALDIPDGEIISDLELLPKSGYLILNPSLVKSSFRVKFPPVSNYQAMIKLDDINYPDILTGKVSLQDPNYEKYVYTGSIVVL